MCQPYIESATALSDIYIYIYIYIELKSHLLVNEKRSVGMAKHFSKKYGNKG